MINDYTNLALAITQWCNRSATDAAFNIQIKNFIFLAEQQIFIDCSTISNQMYVNNILVPGTSTLVKPEGWGRTLTFFITSFAGQGEDVVIPSNSPLERVTLERALILDANNLSVGKPIYYADYGPDLIRVFPAPDIEYPFLLCYYTKPIAINPAQHGTTDSTILKDYPDLLFYCALAKAYAYLHNKEESLFYSSLYMDRLKAIIEYDQNRLIDRNTNPTTFNDVL